MTGASERDWTTAEAIAHGRKWLAAGWAWKRGQIVLVTLRDQRAYAQGVVTSIGDDGEIEEILHFDGGFGVGWGVVPDLRDPGTRGHALDQVRAAWGDEGMDTESEVLLAALRAARE